MNKESVTDVLLIMSRMKHTLFYFFPLFSHVVGSLLSPLIYVIPSKSYPERKEEQLTVRLSWLG